MTGSLNYPFSDQISVIRPAGFHTPPAVQRRSGWYFRPLAVPRSSSRTTSQLIKNTRVVDSQLIHLARLPVECRVSAAIDAWWPTTDFVSAKCLICAGTYYSSHTYRRVERLKSASVRASNALFVIFHSERVLDVAGWIRFERIREVADRHGEPEGSRDYSPGLVLPLYVNKVPHRHGS